MWHTMETTVPDVFVNTTQAGIARVKKGNSHHRECERVNELLIQNGTRREGKRTRTISDGAQQSL